MGVVRRAGTYFDAHPKRQKALEQAIEETQPSSRKTKLGDLCRTRWVQRLDALEVFETLHPSVVACMERICEDGAKKWSADSLADAKGLLLSMTTTDFICALVITNRCMGYLRGLTYSLQAEAKDVVEAVADVDSVINALDDVRKNVESYHKDWYEEAGKMCTSVGVEPSLPRLCGRQKHRHNVPAEDPATYYRRCITIPNDRPFPH